MDLHTLTIAKARKLLSQGQISSVELTQAFLDRVDLYEEGIGAFITLDKDGALAQAAWADKQIAAGNQAPFTGIPIALKDLLCTRGVKTTCASKILGNFVPQYDATVVEKLKKDAAVLIGKTNLDEFAMGSSTENSAFKVTKNPWCPADPAADPLLLWRPSSAAQPLGQTRAVPYASRRPIAGWWGLNPPMGGFPASALFPMPLLWTRSAPSPGMSGMRP
jgi:amidase